MLSGLVPFLVIGVTAGSVYGLAGTGLVLTYKTSGIFNFAEGALATVAAYVFYILQVEHGVPWPVAFLVSVLVLGPIMGLLMELLARRLADVGTVWKVAATIGLVLVVQGFFTAQYGREPRIFPAYFPTSEAFSISGVNVQWDQVIITCVALVTTVALYCFFRFSRLGLAMRAVVDNSELLDMSGTSPSGVRRWAWMIGSTFAALAGVLLAPSLNLDALLLTLLVVQAFGAAAIGSFSSLPLTYIGGLVIGAAAAIATKQIAEHPNLTWLNGLPTSLPFIVLFVVLVVTPRSRLVDRRIVRPPPGETYRAPWRTQCMGAVVVIVLLAVIPNLVSGSDLGIYTDGLTKVVLFLSLGLLVRTSRQVSLCHAGFAAVGAAAFSHFAVSFGLPWLVALLLAGLVVVPVGAVVAIPAIRVSGVFLALATLGFGITLEQMFYPTRIMFGSSGLGLPEPRPGVLGLDGDRAWYYVVLGFAISISLLIVLMTHTRLGRLLRAMADSPLALTTHGASVNTTRVLVFCISAFFAGLYGALYGATIHTVTAAQPAFASFSSLTLLALLCIVLFGEPWYALLAGASLTIIPFYIAEHFSGDKVVNYLNVLFGVSAVMIAIQNGQHAPAAWKRFCDRIGGRSGARRAAPEAREVITPPPLVTRREPTPGRDGIEVEHLTVRYGGTVAVSDVSLKAPMGRITGLIGPNGAGKTTMFNAGSGLVRPWAGTIRLHGEDVSRLSPAARAQRGLGRSFQRMELFDSMTVYENIALGLEASLAGSNVLRHLVSQSRNRAELDEAARSAAARCGVEHLLTKQAGQLSTGERRLVELARALAGTFDVLLLDEPSSGLDAGETERFGEILASVVAERAVAVLLVEHDMALVMRVCDYIYVLDFGAQIFEGSPSEVAGSDVVRAAYLGSDAVLDAVGDTATLTV